MRSSDIFLSLMIFIIFGLIYVLNILSVGIKKIKDNWVSYRCNPMIIPIAGYFDVDPVENFTYCVQNMQAIYMSDLLQPVYFVINGVTGLVGTVTDSLNSIREVFSVF